ncbi:putative short-chain dehydrogenase/reductase family 42E member 2 isoform X1 [Puntigrus tetrazona]|uniref:putative short-chain dehydrogenase/reductase family 42E member 2 isoform X1 n=1 Tax=Puntigrus tetrazona TaxID=1606681 RepID=UPI001C8AC9CE|nr:putative short-chain dehydrogenase/reductase family 42E member 2 isoform X1 [Puntigrus tetrazona]
MKENRSSCQVEQLPCACLLDCHRPTHTRGAAGAPPRHRANGAVGASCNSPNCVVAARLEDPERGRHGAGRVLVTGGAGYFGFRLGRALAGQGATVLLLDLHKPPWDLPDGAVFQQIDIRDYDALYKICAGVDVIYHTASYGMSGPEQLRRKMIESVNVGGTNNIINVCTERGISRLIYTSTVNVAFAGRPIEDGDEDSVPCVQLDMHIDHYSRTKAIAERMVLAANRRSTKGGALLHTCVLRPSGIYGPEERRHLHRVMVNVERRLFSFRFGDPNAKMNWVHVDNLVTAHVLAAEALTADKAYVASGQVYFINDGESVNVFEWLTPLFERLGYGRPLIHLPVSLVYSAAILMERLHVALSPIMEIPLLLTRNEVRNIAVSHTFKIEKAQRELGFSPERYSLKDSVDQYLRSRPPRSAASLLNTRFLFLLLLLLLTGVIALTICRQ